MGDVPADGGTGAPDAPQDVLKLVPAEDILPDPTGLDFSEFHPLWHLWGGSACWATPGGPIRHARYWARYKLADDIGYGIWLRFFCPRGMHRWTTTWVRRQKGDTMLEEREECRWCGEPRPSSGNRGSAT